MDLRLHCCILDVTWTHSTGLARYCAQNLAETKMKSRLMQALSQGHLANMRLAKAVFPCVWIHSLGEEMGRSWLMAGHRGDDQEPTTISQNGIALVALKIGSEHKALDLPYLSGRGPDKPRPKLFMNDMVATAEAKIRCPALLI